MKVICTTHENFSGIAQNRDCPDIGDIVTVIGESIHKGVSVYYFQEWQSPLSQKEIWGYDKRNYSPLSGIDETELVKEREEVYG
jgi:hypothetical protein